MRHLENIYTDLCSLRYLLANCSLSMSSFTLHIYDMIRLLIDLWLWEPIHHCPLTWWIFVPSFTEIRPLSTEISCHAKHLGVNGQLTIARGTQGRTQNFFVGGRICIKLKLYQNQVSNFNDIEQSAAEYGDLTMSQFVHSPPFWIWPIDRKLVFTISRPPETHIAPAPAGQISTQSSNAHLSYL